MPISKLLDLQPDRILIQSQSLPRHEKLFRQAVENGAVYACHCSRKEILESLRQMASAPHSPHSDAPIYDGRCRDPERRKPSQHPTLAWRFRNPEDEEGKQDFIVARTNADGTEFVPSYHWACAIDDYDGDHSILVRAWDLAHVIPQQRLIHSWVGAFESRPRAYPAVFHCSLIVANDDHRLEKRTRGVTLDELNTQRVSPQEILQRCKNSFDVSLIDAFSPGKVWGEKFSQIHLRDIGF